MEYWILVAMYSLWQAPAITMASSHKWMHVSPALLQVALSLRLVVAKALRRMSKLDEAETHFKVLAGACGVGEGLLL